jgi:hypothetical protein
MAGLAAARARGRTGGRPRMMTRAKLRTPVIIGPLPDTDAEGDEGYAIVFGEHLADALAEQLRGAVGVDRRRRGRRRGHRDPGAAAPLHAAAGGFDPVGSITVVSLLSAKRWPATTKLELVKRAANSVRPLGPADVGQRPRPVPSFRACYRRRTHRLRRLQPGLEQSRHALGDRYAARRAGLRAGGCEPMRVPFGHRARAGLAWLRDVALPKIGDRLAGARW